MFILAALADIGSKRLLENDMNMNDNGDRYGWNFGLFFFCMDVFFGILFYVLLIQKDKQLPERDRFMSPCVTFLYWLICCFTSFLGTCCFFLVASLEIDDRLTRVNSPVFVNGTPGKTSDHYPQPNNYGGYYTQSNSNSYTGPVVEAIPVYQRDVSKA